MNDTGTLTCLFDATTVDGAGEPCKGLIFRGRDSVYFTNGVLGHKQTFSLLRRKSCECHRCTWVLEALHDSVSDGDMQLPVEVVDGALYTVEVTDLGQDWYTGEYNGFTLEMVEMNALPTTPEVPQ